MKKLLTISLASLLAACASSSKDIATSYVSPLKYQDYNCKQLAMEIDEVQHRTQVLKKSIDDEASADTAQMAAGMLLFWPALFFLEGGDGPEAAEYSRLKGEYKALHTTAVRKECGIESNSPEEIIKSGDVALSD